MNKTFRIIEWLRTNRTNLPELLVLLDRTDALDFMVHRNVKLIVSTTTVSDGKIRQCSCFLCQEN
jgi:hypothetical protein